jgi:hypothetical protein
MADSLYVAWRRGELLGQRSQASAPTSRARPRMTGGCYKRVTIPERGRGRSRLFLRDQATIYHNLPLGTSGDRVSACPENVPSRCHGFPLVPRTRRTLHRAVPCASAEGIRGDPGNRPTRSPRSAGVLNEKPRGYGRRHGLLDGAVQDAALPATILDSIDKFTGHAVLPDGSPAGQTIGRGFTDWTLSWIPLGCRAAPDREEEPDLCRTIVTLMRRKPCSSLCLFHKILRTMTPGHGVTSPSGGHRRKQP